MVFSKAVDISVDEGRRMAMNILFKSRVEAMELMAQNCMENSQIQESKREQNCIQVTSIITVCSSYFLFQIYFTPENPS